MGTKEELQEWWEKQSREFMRPQALKFNAGEIEIEDGEPCEEGWYSRLSAPGYLDCTEWSGPFDTEIEAVQNLYDMFGDE